MADFSSERIDARRLMHTQIPSMKTLLPSLQGAPIADSLQLSAPFRNWLAVESSLTQGHAPSQVAYSQWLINAGVSWCRSILTWLSWPNARQIRRAVVAPDRPRVCRACSSAQLFLLTTLASFSFLQVLIQGNSLVNTLLDKLHLRVYRPGNPTCDNNWITSLSTEIYKTINPGFCIQQNCLSEMKANKDIFR